MREIRHRMEKYLPISAHVKNPTDCNNFLPETKKILLSTKYKLNSPKIQLHEYFKRLCEIFKT